MGDVAVLQDRIAAVRAERGFTTDPLRLLGLLTEELGEVAGQLKRTWSANYPELVTQDLADELADVFVLLSALATSFGIDLDDAVSRKFFGADAERSWVTAIGTDGPRP